MKVLLISSILSCLLWSYEGQALSPFQYDLKFRPYSEFQQYISEKIEVLPVNLKKSLLSSDVWKQDETRYRDLDLLTTNRYTVQEKEITADGILGSGLSKEFKF